MGATKTWARRASATCALGAAGALAFSGLAIADNVKNDVSNTAGGGRTITAGDAGTVVKYFVEENNAENLRGCDATPASPMTLTIDAPTGVTASPQQLTFTSCGTLQGGVVTNGQSVRFTSDTPSTGAGYAITSTASDSTGVYNTEPSNFKLTVNAATPSPSPANTAPQVSVAGVTDGGTYDKGSVPPAVCEVTDTEDGPSTFDATLSVVTGPYAADGIGSQTATCSYTDRGSPGLTASASKTYSIVDPSAPVISKTVTGTLGDNGWYTSDVTLDWTVSEPESPNSLQDTGCADQSVTTDQDATTYTCSASSAGGSAPEQSVTIKRDATAPTGIQLSGVQDYDWGDAQTTPTCTADGGLSGLASCEVTGGGTSSGQQTWTATAIDGAGNESTTTESYIVRAWTMSGFFSPVDMGGTYNTAKAGSTIPLKFRMYTGPADNRTQLTDVSKVQSFKVYQVPPPAAPATDEVEMVSAGSTSLRYDATGGQFIQNWKTPGAGSYKVVMTALDGSSITAYFTLRK